VTLIRLRGGTEAEWTAANPVLMAKECGVTTDTHRLKVGDGTTEWVDLPYADGAAATSVPTVVVAEDYEFMDGIYLAVALAGCDNVTLPAAYANPGRAVAVKATTDPVTITGAEDIDTEASVTLDPWEALTLISTGSQWVVL
jgi:hypothetical protein